MNQWDKLAVACKTIQHHRYFGAGNSTTELTELTHILGALGDFPDAILWTQAKSLQAHLKGDLASAILFRKREIEMTIKLHSEVVNLEPEVVKFALEDRGIDAIAESKQVLDILLKEESMR